MKNLGKITINARTPNIAVIDIEGTIGMPEQWQFDSQDERVATYEKFQAALQRIQSLDAQTIRVNIRSTGGNVNDALLIYDALCAQGAAVQTHCYGYTASAATIIAQAASLGARHVSANSLYLVHNACTQTEGNAQQVQQTVELLQKTDQRIAALYARRSARDIDTFAQLMAENNGQGRWLTAQETVDLCLADVIEQSSPLKKMTQKVKSFVQTLLTAEQYPTVTVENTQTRLNDMQQRIDNLEAENARLALKPTATLPKEDPNLADVQQKPNQQAYQNDMQTMM